MKQILWTLGRWLVIRNYVCGDDDNAYLHDLKLQIQELKRENAALKLKIIVNKFKPS